MTEYDDFKDALTAQGVIVLAMIAPLAPQQLAAPSTLPGWSVKTLAVHMMGGLRFWASYSDWLKKHSPDEPSSYRHSPIVENRFTAWRFDRSKAAPFWRDSAVRDARLVTDDRLVPRFAQALADARWALDHLPPSRVMKGQGYRHGILLSESVVRTILELTIHTLDLAASLDQPPRLAPVARRITVQTLEGLLSQPRPADLSDDLAFIAKATGRARPGDLGIPAFNVSPDAEQHG
jgi:uncharacterized protein (TIGR03083 family)